MRIYENVGKMRKSRGIVWKSDILVENVLTSTAVATLRNKRESVKQNNVILTIM